MTNDLFIAFLWDERVPLTARHTSLLDRLEHALGLARLLEEGGLVILGAPNAPHVHLPDRVGLVWGTLFDRMTSTRIDGPDAVLGAAAPGSAFAGRYWGGYVAIRRLAHGIEIYRDPSGAMPCYRARIDHAEIFASRCAPLFDLGGLKPEIDWTLLTQGLVYRDLRPPRTALRGIDELMPGTCATLRPGAFTLETLWSPWMFAAPGPHGESDPHAVARVRQAATDCVAAWGRCFQRPLIELSGGLDSSIVAAVLARTGVLATCATFAAGEGDPDETPYARSAASALGLELTVLTPRACAVDLERSQARDLPRPAARAFSQAHDAVLRDHAARIGADAFFSGGGGDNVFALLKSVLPVIDRLKQRERGVRATIADIASLAEVSIWSVVAQAVRRALRIGGPRPWTFDARYLSQSAMRDLPFPHGHPWIDAPLAIPPGKRVHGHSLIVIQNHLEGYGRLEDAPIVSPLLSQPLVETCLAIPTWRWCEGGMNRAIARQAFASTLPPTVIDRRTKGAFDGYSAQVFVAHREAIRAMLLDGALARQGLLDRTAIAATLALETPERRDMVRLLDLVDVEAWASVWQARAKGLLPT